MCLEDNGAMSTAALERYVRKLAACCNSLPMPARGFEKGGRVA